MKNKLFIIFGISIIVYIIASNFVSDAKVAFSIPLCIFAVISIIVGIKGEAILEYINRSSILKVTYKCIKISIGLILILLVLIEGVIISFPKHNIKNSEYILVLGAGLTNGNEPSHILQYRLDAAIECINTNGEDSKIVVSGGQGSDEKISESEAMRNYLIKKGISQEKILTEDKSSNTSENFKYSRRIIENDSGRSIEDVNVKIVTTDFHTFRSRLLAKRNGYNNVTNYSSPTVWYLIPMSYTREAFAVVKSVLFD